MAISFLLTTALKRAALITALAVLAACAPGVTPTTAPTQALIPPTVASTNPAAGSTPTAEVLIPAEAQTLVSLAVQHLADRLSLEASAVTVAALEPAGWAPDVAGCVPQSGDEAVDGYRIILNVGGATYAYRAAGDVSPCDDSLAADAAPTAAADPLAAELVLMAQQRVADETDLSTRRIRVLAVEPVTWTDTSLNCPSPDTAYESAEIAGYRLVLAAGDHEYIFHADFERLIACPPGQETLPEATPESQ